LIEVEMFRVLFYICFFVLCAPVLGHSQDIIDSLPQENALAITPTNQVIELKMEQLELTRKIELLQRDTLDLRNEIAVLKADNLDLGIELDRFKNGVFFGVGFGFNYFTGSPPKYYVRKDSTIGEYGNQNGLSFILSGFMAYKIREKHSLIFNVPLGDVTNREEFKIGLFNQKMAGGIGYGRNLGNVSLIFIINISPYESIEKELLIDEKFDIEKYTKINPQDYPSVTRYSPSFTIGFSYNFQANGRLNPGVITGY
jgi:hypothetical protein